MLTPVLYSVKIIFILFSFANFWAEVTGFSYAEFDRIYYKKGKIKSNRKNKGENYHGLVRIRVKRSTDLNRRIAGWIEGICQQCGVV